MPPISLTDILHRTFVAGLAGVSIYGLYLGELYTRRFYDGEKALREHERNKEYEIFLFHDHHNSKALSGVFQMTDEQLEQREIALAALHNGLVPVRPNKRTTAKPRETPEDKVSRGFPGPDILQRPHPRSQLLLPNSQPDVLQQRLREINHGSLEANHESKMRWIEKVRARDVIADDVDKANKQHYEVSTEFMKLCVGPRMKYSSCLYPTGKETIAQAEELMLESYCEKAKLCDGIDILDLGCGWGSLSLFLAEKYPNARITALSNSATQKVHIDSVAKHKGFKNLTVITGDVNTYEFEESIRFDRILSIEMFEHMKNYEVLMKKVASWLKPNSKAASGEALVFIHIFLHKTTPYDFEEGDGWMAQNFFSGQGTMPSLDLLSYFQTDLKLQRTWFINGRHYAQTSEHWLQLQDANRAAAIAELERDAKAQGFDASEGRKAYYRFRTFFLAVAVFFAMHHGEEWGVGHFLFVGRK
ncbi:S-adenosyl-L-methionine-dependent methyltransferase [Rhizoctonia solani]|uniref:S-adenosyl-L-methionine-dependent methyltransferase n=1 Tax=Rhizoctonia solani TaxID=456999 RepID=A0A8H7IFA4_9AGAM|nr:S-adenosyl-L-methionine-dependent methyltransferase [Rhizoctonia solani]